jgi:hypothetical protein
MLVFGFARGLNKRADPVRADGRAVWPDHQRVQIGMSRIPKILHYIFGMSRDFGGKPWSLVHHVCLKSAIERLRPNDVFFYCEFEPTGPWWKLSRELVTPLMVKAPREIFGRPLVHFAHRADVLRLQKLIEHGGIYLDADVIVHRNFDDLLGHSVVLGQEGEAAEYGLANAVMLAESQSAFLRRWLDQYKSFRSRGWDEFYDEHGVRLPSKLARDYPDEITVLPHTAFHWPLWSDSHLKWIFASKREIPPSASYANHLWQSQAWSYMKELTPGHIRSADTNFSHWVEPLLVGLPDDYGAPSRFRKLQKRALQNAKRVLRKVPGMQKAKRILVAARQARTADGDT